jgi:hypothetical protein
MSVATDEVRQVLMTDGQWHEVEPGTWQDFEAWGKFQFSTPRGEQVYGQREAVLVTLVGSDLAS